MKDRWRSLRTLKKMLKDFPLKTKMGLQFLRKIGNMLKKFSINRNNSMNNIYRKYQKIDK